MVLGIRIVGVCVVGLHDHLNEFVPDDILLVKVDEVDTLQTGKHDLSLFYPALLSTGQIDLSLVTSDDHL